MDRNRRLHKFIAFTPEKASCKLLGEFEAAALRPTPPG
jgi:hypothetical protein